MICLRVLCTFLFVLFAVLLPSKPAFGSRFGYLVSAESGFTLQHRLAMIKLLLS
jgi:hypothetical protein